MALDVASGASVWYTPISDMVPMRPLVLLDALIFVDRISHTSTGGSYHYGIFVNPASGTIVRNILLDVAVTGNQGSSPRFPISATTTDGRFLLSSGLDDPFVFRAFGAREDETLSPDENLLVDLLWATSKVYDTLGSGTPNGIVVRPDGFVAYASEGELRWNRLTEVVPPVMATDVHLPGHTLQSRGVCTPCPAGVVCPRGQPLMLCDDVRRCPVGSAAQLPEEDVAEGVAASSTALPTVDTQLLPLQLKDPEPLLTALLASLIGLSLFFLVLGLLYACGVTSVASKISVLFGVSAAQLHKARNQQAPIEARGDFVAFFFSVLYLGVLSGVAAWVAVIFLGKSVTETTISVAPSFVPDALNTPSDVVLRFDLAGGFGLICDNRIRLNQDVFVAANNGPRPISIKGTPRPNMAGGGCQVELTCSGCSLTPSAVRRQYGCVEVTVLEASVTEFGFAAVRLGMNSSSSSQPKASFAARTATVASSSATPMLAPVFQVSATAFHNHHPEAIDTYNLIHFEGLKGTSNDSVLVNECRQARRGSEARNGTVYLHVSVDSTVVVRSAEYRHTALALLLTLMTLSLQALSSFGAGGSIVRIILKALRRRKEKKSATKLVAISDHLPSEDDDVSSLLNEKEV